MILKYIGIMLIGLILTYILMPLTFKVCIRLNLVDKPEERKVHKDIKLRGGGIGIYLSALLCITSVYLFTGDIKYIGIIISSFILFITGVLDDKFSLPAKLKLLLQIVSATIIIFFGITIHTINFFTWSFNVDGIVGNIITVFWILLLINAINLIDGLDGLASGTTIIILFMLFLFSNDSFTKIISLFLIGSLLCFLKYNFFPSKIFLGDTGSMFLGYIIAILSIIGSSKTIVGMSTILLLCTFPLLDVTLAILRRLINHKPIFSPDKSHIHHRLMQKGLSHKNTVLVIYGLNIIFSIIAFLLFSYQYEFTIIYIMMAYFLFIFGLIKYLNIFKK